MRDLREAPVKGAIKWSGKKKTRRAWLDLNERITIFYMQVWVCSTLWPGQHVSPDRRGLKCCRCRMSNILSPNYFVAQNSSTSVQRQPCRQNYLTNTGKDRSCATPQADQMKCLEAGQVLVLFQPLPPIQWPLSSDLIIALFFALFGRKKEKRKKKKEKNKEPS